MNEAEMREELRGARVELEQSIERLRVESTKRLDELQVQLEKHGDHLAVHDRKFESLEETIREIRATTHDTQTNVNRLLRDMTLQGGAIVKIQKSTARALELLEPAVVVNP